MDTLLKWFGENRYNDNQARIREFWKGNGRFIISVTSEKPPYRQTFDDDIMLKNAKFQLENQAGVPGVNIPWFSPDFGTISSAKYWGGTAHFDSTGMNIFIDPAANTLDEALKLKPVSIDACEMDPPRAIRIWKQLCEQLNTDKLWLRTTDMQGVLNTAGLIMNQEELLMAMYTEPESVHRFLDRVCDHLIEYATYFRKKSDYRICGNIWPFTFFPSEIGISLTEDIMPLLSPEQFKEFGIPYLKRLSDEFEGLHIHCCGHWGRHAQSLAESNMNILAIEQHYPYTPVSELELLTQKTVIIPFLDLDQQDKFKSNIEYYQYLLDNTDESIRYWFAFGDDTEDAIAFAQKHGF